MMLGASTLFYHPGIGTVVAVGGGYSRTVERSLH